MTRKSLVTQFHLLEFGLVIAITATAWVRVPDSVGLPVHWGLDGRPDQIWPKVPALLVAPVLALAVGLLTYLFGRLVPEDQVEPGRPVTEAALAGILGLFAALQFGMLLIGIGSDIDMIRIVAGAVALMLVLIGSALPRSQPNAFSGIRLPWTLRDPRNWTLTHRLSGVVMIAFGLALALLAWFRPDAGTLLPATLAAVFVPLVFAALVSFVLSLGRGRDR